MRANMAHGDPPGSPPFGQPPHGHAPYGQAPYAGQAAFGAAPGAYAHAPIDPRAAALSTQRGLLYAMLPLHLLMLVAEALSLVAQHWRGELDYGSSPFDRGELFGRLLAGGAFLLWGGAGFVWALINLKKLKSPGPSSRTSLLLYWCSSVLSCFCIPIGIFGLVNLSKREVTAALEHR